MTWRELRALALSESWALRHLYCAHGRAVGTAMMRYGDWYAAVDEEPAPVELEPLEIDHGSDRGYQQHKRRRIQVCGDCAAAHVEANRARAQRRAAKVAA